MTSLCKIGGRGFRCEGTVGLLQCLLFFFVCANSLWAYHSDRVVERFATAILTQNPQVRIVLANTETADKNEEKEVARSAFYAKYGYELMSKFLKSELSERMECVFVQDALGGGSGDIIFLKNERAGISEGCWDVPPPLRFGDQWILILDTMYDADGNMRRYTYDIRGSGSIPDMAKQFPFINKDTFFCIARTEEDNAICQKWSAYPGFSHPDAKGYSIFADLKQLHEAVAEASKSGAVLPAALKQVYPRLKTPMGTRIGAKMIQLAEGKESGGRKREKP